MTLNKVEVLSVSHYPVGENMTDYVRFDLADGSSQVLHVEHINEKVTRGELVGYEAPGTAEEVTEEAVPEVSEPVEVKEEEKPKKKTKK